MSAGAALTATTSPVASSRVRLVGCRDSQLLSTDSRAAGPILRSDGATDQRRDQASRGGGGESRLRPVGPKLLAPLAARAAPAPDPGLGPVDQSGAVPAQHHRALRGRGIVGPRELGSEHRGISGVPCGLWNVHRSDLEPEQYRHRRDGHRDPPRTRATDPRGDSRDQRPQGRPRAAGRKSGNGAGGVSLPAGWPDHETAW